MMIGFFIAFLFLLALGFWWYWRQLDADGRDRLSHAVKDNATTLFALLVLSGLPVLLFLPRPEWLPVVAIFTTLLFLWGLFLILYWERRVVPDAVLNDPAPVPYQPRPIPRPIFVPDDGGLPVPEGEGSIHKQFRWAFMPRDGVSQRMEIDLAVDGKRYEEARSEPRRPVGDWAHYAENDMPELDALVAGFYRLHQDRDWSTLEQASNVLCFTQSCIEYSYDKETTPAVDWPRYPIETLMDETGDCEDDVILTAAVLKRLGFDVALLYYPKHVALGVAGADGLPGEYVLVGIGRDVVKYFYGETTTENWHLGQIPEQYRGQPPEDIERVRRLIDS